MREMREGSERRTDYSNLTELRVDVEVLKKDVDVITNLCEKMDKVIEKLVEHQDVLINQIYNDMDKRKTDTNQDIRELDNKIATVNTDLTKKLESTQEKIMDEIKSLRNEIQEHNAKEDSELQKILKWKWTIAGGVIVLSWIFSNLNLFAKLIT